MGDSPAKKLNFELENKENAPSTPLIVDVVATENKPVLEKPTIQETPKVAPGIKVIEAHEPLLQENPQRFVLFPIKYHEVSPTLSRRRVTRKVAPRYARWKHSY